jgi:hypothetical protein
VKRSDLPTVVVLAMVKMYQLRTFEVLSTVYPPKIVLAAFDRDVNKGYLEYGTTVARPWLESKGYEFISETYEKVKR